MNYKEALDFLFSSLPMFQRIGAPAYRANLDNTIAFDECLDHPHRQFKSIHVAGTNGKGSVCHILAAIFQSAGYRTGLYTSPHIKDFRERIRVNGSCIPEENVIRFISQHKAMIQKLKPSFFEMSMAMAFDHFRMEKVDVAVIETGMGGRLDSTNIITPLLSVITNIGFDHTAFLGNTLELIAGEKAGIIKHQIPVIIGETQEIFPVFSRKAAEMESPVYLADQIYSLENIASVVHDKQTFRVFRNGKIYLNRLETDLRGQYQKKNILTALCAIDHLSGHFNISDIDIHRGLGNVIGLTGIRGRWEIIGRRPQVICDCGHNPQGIMEVVKQIDKLSYRALHFVFGMVDDKDPIPVLKLLPEKAVCYFTQASIPRAMDKDKLAAAARKVGLQGVTYPSPMLALEAAKNAAGVDDLVVVGGSTFVVAEVL
jgi:dihydrofolate synthase/folylpolyglutamate synthase